MIKLEIISGTDRPNSNAMRVSKYVQRLYRETGAEVGITDLQQFPLEAVKGGQYGEDVPEVKKFIRPVLGADGLIMVVPEYNGSYPGILKLFIDYLPFPRAFEKLPISFIGESSGSFGALRAVEQLQMVAGYRNAYVFPERVFISRIHENFDEKRGVLNEMQRKLLFSQVENFTQYVASLKSEELVAKPLSL